jgi:DDE superfamily endonuclease
MCIGYVDGTHVNLEEAPTMDRESYFDKNKNYSLQVQIICDPKKRIIHYVAGYPGSCHDSRVWNECEIKREPEKYFSGGKKLRLYFFH